ncbi:MAG TPA: GNAT family N-acetyltransferase [Burkholderiales bacterium]|jgi:GNAT superfamily N-acetyltransferase|nr:GNAT family N-acetyltransferase [Burkholderiales bacterium]
MNAVLPEIRILGSNDRASLERVEAGVFDGQIDPPLSAEFLADPRHLMAVAVVDGKVVGMASAVHYVHPDKPSSLWVNKVGVAPVYRSQGIGRKLIEALFARGTALGCNDAWLDTERSNIPARRLFGVMGGVEALDPVVRVSFRLQTERFSGSK